MFVGSFADLFLPTSFYLCLLLAFLCVRAFRRRGSRLRRYRYALLGLVTWSCVFTSPGVALLFVNRLEQAYPRITEPTAPDDPLIVVLSSGYIDGNPKDFETRLDTAGWERTYAAIRLWRRIGGKLLFVGQPTSHHSSVASYMADIAILSGVPAPSVLVEGKSRTTHENLAFNRERILEHGDNVWLVTSALHMPRAMAVARAKGLKVTAYPCDYRGGVTHHWYAWLPNSGGPAAFADAFHEIVGRLYYRLRGRAD